jgi:glyoxalase family protein
MTEHPTLPGIHHITAIASDPQRNVDFYQGLLGLRLVKQTVNFDDPGSYHLYYGDALGRPGTILTFFAWPGAPRGRAGVGQVGATAFSVPGESLSFWQERLTGAGVAVIDGGTRFGDRVLSFTDPDGMFLELIGAEDDSRPGWIDGPVPVEFAVRGFHAPTLLINRHAPSTALLTDVMDFRQVGQEGTRLRFAAGDGGPGSLVDLVEAPGRVPHQAAGTVHHIAWRTPTDADELGWRSNLQRHDIPVTEVRDRQYFHSIYYREPGGILYEIATDEPGFAVDEAPDRLGTSLMLPAWLEPRRAQIEQALPAIQLPITHQTEPSNV